MRNNTGQEELDKLKEKLEEMSTLYQEHRSDVSDMLDHLLETGELIHEAREHRFAILTIDPEDLHLNSKGQYEIEYDTLTTLFSTPDSKGWYVSVGEVEYVDSR